MVIIDAAESSGAPSDGAPVTEWFKEMIDPFRRRKRTVGCWFLTMYLRGVNTVQEGP